MVENPDGTTTIQKLDAVYTADDELLQIKAQLMNEVVSAQRVSDLSSLLALVIQLDLNLPNSALDVLLDGMGGEDMVAEMTGRRGRVLKETYTFRGNTNTKYVYRKRSEDSSVAENKLNLKEKQVRLDVYLVWACLKVFNRRSWMGKNSLPSSVMPRPPVRRVCPG